jgi:hypothetical protein
MTAYERGLVAPLVNFLQQRLAENDDPERTHAGEQAKQEVYDVQSDWPDEVQRLMHIDVQEDHFWAEGTQFAANGDARQIFYLKVSTDEELRVLQTANRIPDNCVFMDIGFQRNRQDADGATVRRVYEIICKYSWCGLKGEDRDAYPHNVNGKFVYRLYSTPKFGDPQADIVDRIRRGRGAKWTVPPGSQEYARQLFAEQKVRKFDERTGREVQAWVRKRRDNHAFDLAKMKVITALMSPLIRLDTTQAVDAPEPKPETTTETESQ